MAVNIFANIYIRRDREREILNVKPKICGENKKGFYCEKFLSLLKVS